MTSCNALVYEAIQRVYRNAVVDRIRSGMQAAYPDDYENRVTSPFPPGMTLLAPLPSPLSPASSPTPIKMSSTISM